MNQAPADYSKMTYCERQVWAVVGCRHGKDRAINQYKLADITNKTPRKVRLTVESLIVNHRLLICSSYDGDNGGYYLPETDAEIKETCKKLHGHALKILVRESVLKKINLADLLSQYQTEIPFDD